VAGRVTELRDAMIEAATRVHADPLWSEHIGTQRLAAEMALKQTAKKALGFTE
jgi:hypothetical protein